MTRLTLLLLCIALPAASETFQCEGSAPEWRLALDEAQGEFAFPAPTEMDVMLVTLAEGQDWPRAYTLIGARDTAIVLIEQETCQMSSYRAHVMTQRGQTPILLTGCCKVAR